MVANAARWLGLLSFEDFEDRRNSDPLIYRAQRDTTALEVGVYAGFDAEPPSIDLTDSDAGEIDLSPTIAGIKAEQPFLLAIFGEKSSIAREARRFAPTFIWRPASNRSPTPTTSPSALISMAGLRWWGASPTAIRAATRWRSQSPARCRR